jgi:hypothetical protein
MVNPERGGVEIQAGDVTYVFRLGFVGLARLQRILSTPERRMPLPELLEKLQAVMTPSAAGDIDLEFLLMVMLAGFHEFHGDTIKTPSDVETVILKAGGLEAFQGQLNQVAESLAPDAEDQKRREANPRKAQRKAS